MMRKVEKYVSMAKEEKPCPLISVMKGSKLLCQWYIRYWCCAWIFRKKKKEQKIFL